jgi:alpha-maltose-1-phosphate synthase
VRVDLLSREYPPEIYGGAGVHVAELVRALRTRGDLDVRVHAFGAPRADPATSSYPVPTQPDDEVLRTLAVDVAMVAGCAGTDLAHSHTWYANLAGHLAGLRHGVPHVITAHSLEPLRPWKAEQLGGGYAVSSWIERTAYEAADAVIAVSAAMREDVVAAYPDIDDSRVHMVHNGIDTQLWQPVEDPDRVRALGVNPDRPMVLFIGRITRQKGLPLFLRAAAALPPDTQLVLCAGAPDTPEIEAEVAEHADRLHQDRGGVVWIREMLPRADVIALLSCASIFVCPSIYEPLGIVNLEAMACQAPVVATAVGGIPEVVSHGETGLLVPLELTEGVPSEPDRYVTDLAAALTELLEDPAQARAMGVAGRRRAIETFSWERIAEQTAAIYRGLT